MLVCTEELVALTHILVPLSNPHINMPPLPCRMRDAFPGAAVGPLLGFYSESSPVNKDGERD